MNALLAALAVIIGVAVALGVTGGASALSVCVVAALVAGLLIARVSEDRELLLRLFVGGVLVRVLVGTVIYVFNLQEFFGGDALTYDDVGAAVMRTWFGGVSAQNYAGEWQQRGGGWGMVYIVAAIYSVVGRNMLAVQFFNAVVGAATAPIIFLCARHIFRNQRVAVLAAIGVAFYPSLVLWSAQGLKDGPIVFLLALIMLSTLELGEHFNVKHLGVLVFALFAVLSLRFYVFYMAVAAVFGAFLVGMRPRGTRGLARQLLIIAALGLGLTYLGVLRTASSQVETLGSLEAVQRSRSDLARSAASGFGQDVDVSTASGALTAIPVGMIYLLFAPFPWQVANLRQSITIPEMVIWWASFPLLVIGVWFTIKYRLRQALPILIFTTMLTLAYSVFQGNVGTAYRQRSQILVFYFIFVAAGGILVKERQEDKKRAGLAAKQAAVDAWRAAQARRRFEQWKGEQEPQLESMARDISRRIDF